MYLWSKRLLLIMPLKLAFTLLQTGGRFSSVFRLIPLSLRTPDVAEKMVAIIDLKSRTDFFQLELDCLCGPFSSTRSVTEIRADKYPTIR